MAELMTTTQTAQNDLKAKTKTKKNRKTQSNNSKPKGEAAKRHKRPYDYDMPPSQVQIDPSLNGQTGIPRNSFSISGTVQPPDAQVYGYLYGRIAQMRWPNPVAQATLHGGGVWTIDFGDVPASLAGPCYLKVYITGSDPASDMDSISFAP
jgi:hypothetical protein